MAVPKTFTVWRCARWLIASLTATTWVGHTSAQDVKANYFNDPFEQVTHAIAECPVPAGPAITQAAMRAQAHSRAERGTSCYLSGRCRLPNAYMYDSEIIPRVKKAIEVSGRFNDSSVWIEGQRRWVTLEGCVRRKSDARDLERLVRSIDDVEVVIDNLTIRPR